MSSLKGQPATLTLLPYLVLRSCSDGDGEDSSGGVHDGGIGFSRRVDEADLLEYDDGLLGSLVLLFCILEHVFVDPVSGLIVDTVVLLGDTESQGSMSELMKFHTLGERCI